jgi:hypothetical protein
MAISTERTTPIEIVAYEEETNLRTITWNQRFLDSVREEHNLKHRQAILYVNGAQDRFRLVACFYGLAVLVLPPTSTEERLSIYIKVGEFLRRLSSPKAKDMNKFIGAEIDNARHRIEVRNNMRKSRAKQAVAARKGGKS